VVEAVAEAFLGEARPVEFGNRFYRYP